MSRATALACAALAVLTLGRPALTAAQNAASPQPAPARPAARQTAPRPQGPVTAITNARILTAAGPVIERGTVLIQGGTITAVGAGVAVPQGATEIDAAGKTVTPGFFESATSIGIVEISLSAEGTVDQTTTDPGLSAAFTVVDAFNPDSTVVPVTRVEGITRALVLPAGTGHVLLGQGAVFDLGGAHVPDSLTRAPAAMIAALGEAGAAVTGGSRSSAILRLREALQDARDYGQNRLAYNTARRRDYARGRLDLEALQPVLRGEVPLAVQANRASDLLAAMRLADEFTLRLVLMGAAEGWRIADEIARRKIPVVVKPLTNLPTFDAIGATLENAARLASAGVTLAISTFDTHNARNLRQEAGNAIAHGLDRDAALRAVTIVPATIWGVADRCGSLQPGRAADLVIWSGDPFELTTTAERVFIAGREMPPDTRQRSLLEKYRQIR